MTTNEKVQPLKPIIGWREWVALPELGIAAVKPKIDTGARSSSLHAVRIEEFRRGDTLWVRFQVHPIQRSSQITVEAEAEVLEYRTVTSSSGQGTLRPVILTDVEVLGHRWPIELTLADRDSMGFRMLLGREAIRGRFFVDAGRSYYGGKPKSKRKRKTEKSRSERPRRSTEGTEKIQHREEE